MIIKKGRDRIVMILPTLGVVVKFPIIHLVYTWKFFVDAFTVEHKIGKWAYLKVMWGFPIDTHCSPKYFLFKGLSANWNEFLLYQKTYSSFLQPTYFSLFGLFNIQKYNQSCDFSRESIWVQLYAITKGRVWDDCHHFDNPDNFAFYDEKLRMLDYGSRKVRGVITEYGEKIVDDFNPNYVREEPKP